MTWNQIEDKWAAMARRVRADWKGATLDDASPREIIVTDKKLGSGLLADATPRDTSTATAE